MADDGAALETRVIQSLERIGLPFEVIECDPALADTAAFCEHYNVELADSANTIIVASKRPKGVFAACVVLATTRLDENKAVKRELDVSRLSFASPEQTMRLTGMLIGGVTPPGLPPEIPLLIDAQVMARDSVVIGGGSRSTKVRMSPDVLALLPGARVVKGLAYAPE